MHTETFIITFEDGEQIKETTFSLEQAKILAQAERIKQAKSYKIIDWCMVKEYNHYNACDGYCDTCGRQHVCLD